MKSKIFTVTFEVPLDMSDQNLFDELTYMCEDAYYPINFLILSEETLNE